MANEKWTQKERDAACIGFSKDGIMTRRTDALSDANFDAVIDLACQRNALRDALQYMYDSARELSCECFELGAIEQARAALAKCKPLGRR